MNKDFIGKMLVNSARKTMLENVDAIDDIKFLQKELKDSLRKQFNLERELKEKDKVIDDAIGLTNHMIKELDKRDMLHPAETELLEILERGKNVNSK